MVGAGVGVRVTDRCAACFQPLRVAIHGARLACDCKPPNNFRPLRGRYLTEFEPEAPHTLDATVESRHGAPTLHLYGSVPR